MFNLPVDTSAMSFIVGGRTEPVFERGTDRPKVDQETGKPLFAVQLVALAEGRADVLNVKVAGQAPELPQGTPVRVVGLVATPWTMNDRAGVAFRAAAVERLDGPKPARQAS